MAKADIKLHDSGGLNIPVKTYQTEAGATAINAGEPVKLKAAGSPYVIPLADGDPVIGTTTQVMGVAKSAGTHTASADGTIDVYVPVPWALWKAKAKTAASVDTQSEIDLLENDRKVLDLTSSSYTVDEAAADGATSGIQIKGGNPTTKELYFSFRPGATEGPIA